MSKALISSWKESSTGKLIFSVVGIMATLLVYGVLQEKIMRIPYGVEKEYFRFSLFLVLCNRMTTSAVSAAALLALKYVSFPVQTLGKCAKMIPVMVWSTFIMQKKYNSKDYLFAALVTFGCALFILYPASGDINPYQKGRESTVWGVSLMMGYLGFDGFTSTFQDKLFKGYDMEIHNQIFYTTLCSTFLSFAGLVLQGHLLTAISFMVRHQDCIYDVLLLSIVATASQFFISYTIRTFGALTFATIMTTRQLVSIMLSCVWFSHPLSWEQWSGAGIVFGTLYTKSFFGRKHQLPLTQIDGADKAQGSVNT